MAAATHVPRFPRPHQPWGQELPQLPLPTSPGVEPYVQSSSTKSRLSAVGSSLPAGFWELLGPRALKLPPTAPAMLQGGRPGQWASLDKGCLSSLGRTGFWGAAAGCPRPSLERAVHVVLTPLFSSCRMQHWARRLEQEVDGVMRIFGGVQQLREVSLQPLLPSLQGLSWGWEWEEAFRNKERGKPGLVRSMGQVWGRWGNSRKAATPRGLAHPPAGSLEAAPGRLCQGVRLSRFAEGEVCVGWEPRPQRGLGAGVHGSRRDGPQPNQPTEQRRPLSETVNPGLGE